jgi:hypothetical protein
VARGNDQSRLVSNVVANGRVPTYAFQVIQSVKLGAQTAVYAQELLVHDCSQGQCAERVHACFVDGLGVLVLALELECEVISQMSAFVVSAEQPERVRVPNLQRPQVENALRRFSICATSLWLLIPQY